MQSLDPEFAARLAAATTTLCWCWRFQRRDGEVFGATDHDRTVMLDELACNPAHGLDAVELISNDSLAPGRASLSGALDLAFMTAADLDAGRWDGARVDVWRIDWMAPQHRIHMWAGRLSDVSRQGARFQADLVSLKADLERMIGRVYARTCDAELGDARCGVDLSVAPHRAAGVAQTIDGNAITSTGLAGAVSGDFTGGVLTWSGGAWAGLRARVQLHAGDRLDLSGPVAAPGDAFTVTAGCDKSFATCGARFSNRDNFRGFPHMPGPDAVLAGPSSNADGGRRT